MCGRSRTLWAGLRGGMRERRSEGGSGSQVVEGEVGGVKRKGCGREIEYMSQIVLFITYMYCFD